MEKVDISLFTNACDELANSKFILVDKRISDCLKAIADIPAVYNKIAECMINYNFTKDYTKATSKLGEFDAPTKPKDFVAFVFCLLKRIDENKINISQLLINHFGDATPAKRTNYAVFVDTIIIKFKNLVTELIIPPKQAPVNIKVEVTEHKQTADLSNITKDVTQMVSNKKIFKCKIGKQEYIKLLEMLGYAINTNNTYYIKEISSLLLKLKCKDKKISEAIKNITQKLQIKE